MAKIDRTVTFANASFNTKDMTITETTKDGMNTYNLQEILDSWTGIEGITFSLKQVDELEPMEDNEVGEDEN